MCPGTRADPSDPRAVTIGKKFREGPFMADFGPHVWMSFLYPVSGMGVYRVAEMEIHALHTEQRARQRRTALSICDG